MKYKKLILIILPTLFLFGLNIKNLIYLKTGERYTIEVQGYDPRDFLRGNYLSLKPIYKDTVPLKEVGDKIYYCLKPYEKFVLETKDCQLYIRGKLIYDNNFKAGIEKFYIPQEHAYLLESKLQNKQMKMKLIIASNGMTMIEDLLVDGQNWKDFLKDNTK
jgi:uncharacterized membrane-anchored protein